MKEDFVPDRNPRQLESLPEDATSRMPESCGLKPTYPAWLYQFLPHAYVTSRSFLVVETRGQRVTEADDLIRLSLRRIGHILMVAVIVWCFLICGAMLSDTPGVYLDLIWDILGVLLVFSLLDRFVLDFAGVIAPLDSISRDMTERRWGLIRMSNVSMRHLVRAKYAAAQIQVWPILISVMSIRLVVVGLSSSTLIVAPLLIPENYGVVNIYDTDLLTFLFLAVSWGIVSAIYVFEPRWRLRTLVAAGLAVSSSRIGNRPGSMLLAGLAMILRIWVAQIFIFFASACAATAVLGLAFRLEHSIYGSSTGVGYALQCLLVGLIIYKVYDGHTRTWLDLTYERLVRRGGAP